MRTTKFVNGLILDQDFNVSAQDVMVTGSEITHLGDLSLSPADDIIDMHGNLLIPGFINLHTHSAMTLFRSLADDLSLQSWLFDKIFPMEAQLTADDVYYATQLAILEYWQSGITCFKDMYLFPETILKASMDINAKAYVITVGIEAEDKSIKEKVDLYEAFYLKYRDVPLGGVRFGLHAPYTTEPEFRTAMAAMINKYQAPFYIHLSETNFEHQQQLELSQRTPLQEMLANGLYQYGGGAYHAVWFDDQDCQLAKDHKITIVHNPSSNLKLASGIAPIYKMHDLGNNIGLGTDGPASNNALDFFREMYLAAVLPKVSNNDASAMDAIEVLKMATINGALGLGLSDTGLIKIGNKADLVMIDLQQPNMQPINNVLKNIVYAGSKSNVKLTMVEGKIVYHDGKFPGVDVNKIYKNVQNTIDRIKRKMEDNSGAK